MSRKAVRNLARGDRVRPRYPYPPNQDRMTEEQIAAWYDNRLPELERKKYRVVLSIIDSEKARHTEREYVTVMNHFHADPGEPVDVNEVLADVGVDVAEITPRECVEPTVLADMGIETADVGELLEECGLVTEVSE